jgi:Tol biopolymer transport system component
MLAFGSSAKAKYTLWKIELPEFDRVTPVVPSTRFDSEADFSPDGHSITFFSNRSGSPEVWVSDLDSTGLHRVTEGANLKSAPRWSPEGSWIAYSTDWQLFVVPVAGGAPVRIPTGGARAAHPSWSRDGQWLYYSSERQVWRIRLDGSTRLPVAGTQGTFLAVEGGAFLAVESPDRKSIFYPRRGEPFTLCKVPIEGGPEEVVQHGLATPAFAVSQKYVYYIRSDRVLYQAPLAGGHARKLGYLPDPVHSPPGRIEFGIAVAPDDSGVIYSVTGPQEVDLQLQRNFQ